jgi:ribokinase
MKNNRILVVGSANMDLVVGVRDFPHPGETIFGKKFSMFPGGKGANQAVACARLGSRVVFLGKMGRDLFGEKLRQSMLLDKVDLRHCLLDRHAPTGIALIAVNTSGENEIVVVSGSNMALSPSDIKKHEAAFRLCSVTLLQLEIPLDTVYRAVQLGKRHHHQVILNPAPARRLPARLLRSVDLLTPNETEAEILTGIPVKSRRTAVTAARMLLSKGVKNVILTMGKKGCLLATRAGTQFFRAPTVRAVDTTAAGDAFNGALAHALAQNVALAEAVRFAVWAASCSVMRPGAQSSMPTMDEVRTFISGRKPHA